MKTFITPEKQGFRDFDLPKEHLLDTRHYIPPKTHDPSEIVRRRELNPGTLVAEQQFHGLAVSARILDQLQEQEGLIFAANMLAAAGLNSAWYSYAQRAHDVMRRRLKLPIMLHQRTRNPDLLMEDARAGIVSARDEAGRLVAALEYEPMRIDERQREVGLRTGNAALRLACYEAVVRGDFDGDTISDHDMQSHVRDIALDALAAGRTLHRDIGSHPSIAQLSDPYSHLSVYWHRKAPGSAQKAIIDALTS